MLPTAVGKRTGCVRVAVEPAAPKPKRLDAAVRSIEFVAPALPPVHDAIGEYTERLAATLAGSVAARVLVGFQSEFQVDPCVVVEPAFAFNRAGRLRLADRLVATEADAVVIQYNPFGWGCRGWAPELVRAAKMMKRHRPDVMLGVMFHETYMMNAGWRAWVMRRYQVPQFRRLAAAADVCFFSTEAWAKKESARRPAARVHHLPVGSNLPHSEANPLETRRQLGIPANAFVVGAFGQNHPSRRFDWVREGAELASGLVADRLVVILHVGGRGDELPGGPTPLIATGRLPAAEAADAIAAMDVMLNPFVDGVSSRRGSAIAALQQGVPLVSVRGEATDALWESGPAEGLYLAVDPTEDSWRAAVHRAMQGLIPHNPQLKPLIVNFHEANFAWSRIASQLLRGLEATASK